MVAKNNLCDRNRLKLLLSDDLMQAQADETHRHLESCQTCRSELESLAAEAEVWSEMPRYLSPDAQDPSAPLSHMTQTRVLAGCDAAPALPAIETVLERLLPTDNPAMLGRLGEYDVLEVIGCGGMGVVLKAYDRQLNRFVAIKVLAPHFASNAAARTRFAREAKAAAAVVHAHVVSIHGVADTDSLPYFVMQFVPGQSLQQRIDTDAPLDLKDILRIGVQASRGLAAAHAQGLVHRDIKPANILLENGIERVILSDFGLARAADDASMTQSGVIAGTPQFMSPEQARGEPIDSRSDLFSLGSALYAMCTGHSPFRADTTVGVLYRIYNEQPRPVRSVNSEIPKWFEAILSKMLSKDPQQRFQSADEVADVLEQWLAHVQQPDVVPPPASQHVTGQSIGKPPWSIGRAIVAAGGAMLFLFFTVVVLIQWNKGTLKIVCNDAQVPVRIMHGDKVYDELTVMPGQDTIRVGAGDYLVVIDTPGSGLVVEDGGKVTVTRGNTSTVVISQHESNGKLPGANSNPIIYGRPNDAIVAPDTVLDELKNEFRLNTNDLPRDAKLIVSGIAAEDHLLLLWLSSNVKPWNGDSLEILYEIDLTESEEARRSVDQIKFNIHPAGGKLLTPLVREKRVVASKVRAKFDLPILNERRLLIALPFPSAELAEAAEARLMPLKDQNLCEHFGVRKFDLLGQMPALDPHILRGYHLHFTIVSPPAKDELAFLPTDQPSDEPVYQGQTLQQWLTGLDENRFNVETVMEPIEALRVDAVLPPIRKIFDERVRVIRRERDPKRLASEILVLCLLAGHDFSNEAIDTTIATIRRQPTFGTLSMFDDDARDSGARSLLHLAQAGLLRLKEETVHSRMAQEIASGNSQSRYFALAYCRPKNTGRFATGPVPIAALLKASNDKIAIVRRAAIAKLATIYPTDPQTKARIHLALDDPNSLLVYDAAIHLSKLDPLHESLLPRLLQMAQRDDAWAQCMAVTALTNVAGRDPKALQAVIDLLADESWGNSAFSVSQQWSGWARDEIPTLQPVPQPFGTGTTYSGRHSAIYGLGKLGPKAEPALELIRKHIFGAQSEVIRTAAKTAYKEISGKDPPPPRQA